MKQSRHLNLPRNNNICPNCLNNKIENVYQFLLICSKYSDLRTKYINDITILGHCYKQYTTYSALSLLLLLKIYQNLYTMLIRKKSSFTQNVLRC